MTHKTWKSLLLAGSALAMAAGAAPLALADAAPKASAADTEVTAVTVTARRREESLKDVPISVTAYSAARMEQVGAFDVTDLQQTAPNATIQTARGSNSTLIAFMRGVGQQDPLWGFEPGVGVYVDDVYFARPQLSVLDIYDVKDIEILRGPQGTLYGRNTIGGAIKYTSARIGSDTKIFAKGEFGSYGQHDEIVGVKLPVTSTLGVSATVAKYDRDGYGKNISNGSDQYNKDVTAARATVEWTPTSKLFVRLAGDFTQDDSLPRNGHREAAFGAYTVLPGVYDTAGGAGNHNLVKSAGVALTAEYQLDEHYTLKSISAIRSGHTSTTIDFDNEPAPILDVPGQYKDRQTSQEFQILFNRDKLHGVAGVFYLNSLASGAFDTVLGTLTILPSKPGYSILTQGYVRTESVSAFADASYDLTDRLQLSVGGRWTEDDKRGHVFRQAYAGVRSPFFGDTTAIALGTPNTNYTNDKTFEKFTPRVSASFKLTDELTAYASWSKGFKSGGFDMRGDAKAYPATVNGYRPETVSTTEIGLKGSVYEHRLNYAIDVFASEYKDQQITTQYASGATIASVVDNVGSSSIQGLEAEGSLRLTPELTLNSTLGLINANYDKYLAYIPGTGLTDVSGQRSFQNTPKITFSANATYVVKLGDWGKVALTPAISFRDKYQMFETATPLLDQKSYWLENVDAVWTSADGRYDVGFHAKNLTDARYKVGGYNFPGALYGNSISSFYGPPRTYTVTVGVKF
jgi:iron complex outermembrane receptor protein